MLTETQLLAAQPVIRAVCSKYLNAGECDDLVQDVLMRLWEKRAMFEDGDIEHFVARVARRFCITQARQRVRQREVEPYAYVRGVATPEDTLLAAEAIRVYEAVYEAELSRRTHWRCRAQAISVARQKTREKTRERLAA